jgi:ribosomal protein S26
MMELCEKFVPFFPTLNDMELKCASAVAVYARPACLLQCIDCAVHSTLTLCRSYVQRDCGRQTNGALCSAVEG